MKEYFKKSQRLVALVLTVLMAFTMMPVNSFAATSNKGVAWDGSDRDTAQATTYTVSGTVKGSDTKKIVKNATVTLKKGTKTVKSMKVTTAGTFKFTSIAKASDYKVSVAASGYTTYTSPAFAVSKNLTKNVNLASSLKVTGTVKNADGKVVSGATVSLKKGTATAVTAKTNASGVYTFSKVARGADYTVSATATGYKASTAAKLTVDGNETKNITLAFATYSVTYNKNGATGTVTDTTKYRKDVSVKVKASTGLTYADHTFAGWNTKADGKGTSYAAGSSFKITANTTLYAIWNKNAAPTVTKVEVTPETATIVAAGGTQQFTAKVTGTNSPAQTVKWSISGTELNALTTIGETTGLLTVNAADAGKTITVKATSTVNTAISGTATVTVEAAPIAKFTVSGTVTSTEEPTGIVGATVKLVKGTTTLEATTIAGGAFSFANVEAAEGYKLEVKHTGYVDYASATAFNVTADTTQNIVLVKEVVKTSIDKVTFGTVTAPVLGAIPVTAYTPADTTANYTGAITWAPVAAAFAAETEYVATLTLTAKDGFKFKDGFAAADITGFPATGAVFTPSADNGATVKVAITYAKMATITAVASVAATSAANNNVLTVMMTTNLTEIPTAKDLTIKAAVNGGTATTIAVADADVKFALSNLKEVVINVPLVKATNAAQSVVYTVAYKTTTAQSGTLTVAALDAVTISSIMVKNAYTIDVTLSKAFAGLTASDFDVKSGATSTAISSAKAVTAAAPNATNTVYTLTVADITVEHFVTVAAKGTNLVASTATTQYRQSSEVLTGGIEMESDTMIKVTLAATPATTLTTADISRFTVKFTQTLPTKATEVEIIPTNLYHFGTETNVRLVLPSLAGKTGLLTVNGKTTANVTSPVSPDNDNVDFIAPIAELVAPIAGAQASLVVRFDSAIKADSQKTVQSDLLTSLSYNGSALTSNSIIWDASGKFVTIYIPSTVFAIGNPVVVEFKDIILDTATPGNKLATLKLQTVVVDTPTVDVSFTSPNVIIGGGATKDVSTRTPVAYANRAAVSILASKTDKQTLSVSNVTGVTASKVALSAVIASGTQQEITVDATEVAPLGADVKFDLTVNETGKSPITYKFTIKVLGAAATDFTTVTVTKPASGVTVTAPKTANVSITGIANGDRADIKLALNKKTTQTVTITGGTNSNLATLGGATSVAQEIVVNGTSLATAGGNIVFEVTVKEAGLQDAKQMITITVDALKGLPTGTPYTVKSTAVSLAAGEIHIATTGLISAIPAGTTAVLTYDSAAKLSGYNELVALAGTNGLAATDEILIDKDGKVNAVTVALGTTAAADRTLDLSGKVAANCALVLSAGATHALTVVGNIGSGRVTVNGTSPKLNLTGLITTGLVDISGATVTPILKIANNTKFSVAATTAQTIVNTTVNGLSINVNAPTQFTFKDNKFTTVGSATTYTLDANTTDSGIQAPTTIEFIGSPQTGDFTSVTANKTHKLSFVTATYANSADFLSINGVGSVPAVAGKGFGVVEIGDNFAGTATLTDADVKVIMRGITLQLESAKTLGTMKQTVTGDATNITLDAKEFIIPAGTTSTIGANTKLTVGTATANLTVLGTLNVANAGVLALTKANAHLDGALVIKDKGVVKVAQGGSIAIGTGAGATQGVGIVVRDAGTLELFNDSFKTGGSLADSTNGSIWAGAGSTFKVGTDYFTSPLTSQNPYFTLVGVQTVLQYVVNSTLTSTRLLCIRDVATGSTTAVTLNKELLVPASRNLEIQSPMGLALATGVKLIGSANSTITTGEDGRVVTGTGASLASGNFYVGTVATTTTREACTADTIYTWEPSLDNNAGGWLRAN